MVKEQNKSKAIQTNKRRAIKYWPATERPLEKLLHLGPGGLSAKRKVIAKLKDEAEVKSGQVKNDIEAMILGTKPVPDAN